MVIALLVRVAVEVDKKLVQRRKGEFTSVAANGGPVVGIVFTEDCFIAWLEQIEQRVRQSVDVRGPPVA